MLWLLFDGWFRFPTSKAFAFSVEENSELIDFFIPKSQIGLVTLTKGDKQPKLVKNGTRVEAIQMIGWLAKELADEHGLEYEE